MNWVGYGESFWHHLYHDTDPLPHGWIAVTLFPLEPGFNSYIIAWLGWIRFQ